MNANRFGTLVQSLGALTPGQRAALVALLQRGAAAAERANPRHADGAPGRAPPSPGPGPGVPGITDAARLRLRVPAVRLRELGRTEAASWWRWPPAIS